MDVVAVVALLHSRLDYSVPASRHDTVHAGVRRHVIAVIAFFLADPDDTVAADGEGARGQARVPIIHVPIVALLVVVDDAVAASRKRTLSGAPVAVREVAVVTRLARADEPVSTPSRSAGVRAQVGVVIIAVVALFTVLNDAVSTARETARRGAFVLVRMVAVVALLVAVSQHAIAAPCCNACAQTRIGIVGIAVVTLFRVLHDSVAAEVRAHPATARRREPGRPWHNRRR